MSHTETRIKVQFPAAERWTVTGGKKSKCVFLYARAKYEPPVDLRLCTSAPPLVQAGGSVGPAATT